MDPQSGRLRIDPYIFPLRSPWYETRALLNFFRQHLVTLPSPQTHDTLGFFFPVPFPTIFLRLLHCKILLSQRRACDNTPALKRSLSPRINLREPALHRLYIFPGKEINIVFQPSDLNLWFFPQPAGKLIYRGLEGFWSQQKQTWRGYNHSTNMFFEKQHMENRVDLSGKPPAYFLRNPKKGHSS